MSNTDLIINHSLPLYVVKVNYDKHFNQGV